MTSVPPPVIARLWDSNFTLRHTVDADAIGSTGDGRTITLPLDHPAARWLINDVPNERGANLTIDGPNGRWSGPLRHFEVSKVGGCPQCGHCQQKIVRSVWNQLR